MLCLLSAHHLESFHTVQVSCAGGLAARAEVWPARGHIRHGLHPGRADHAAAAAARLLRGLSLHGFSVWRIFGRKDNLILRNQHAQL